MFSLNKAQLIGNLTRDPETKTLPSGLLVCSFGVATNRRWRDKDGNQKEDTQFHDVTVWGKMAEWASQMLQKGKRVYVEGRLQTNSWEGTDGVKRSRTEIVAENFIPLSPREDGYQPATANQDEKPSSDKSTKKSEKTDDISAGTTDEINLDDIPF